MSSATKYVVTVSKRMEYLSSVIDRRNKLKDLVFKAQNDLVETIMSTGTLGNEFTISLDSEMPYISKSSIKSEEPALQKKVGNVNLEFCIREFVQNDLVEKFGTLDPKINPNLFEVEMEDVYDDKDKVIETISNYYYNKEVQDYWDKKYETYIKIIKTKGI